MAIMHKDLNDTVQRLAQDAAKSETEDNEAQYKRAFAIFAENRKAAQQVIRTFRTNVQRCQFLAPKIDESFSKAENAYEQALATGATKFWPTIQSLGLRYKSVVDSARTTGCVG